MLSRCSALCFVALLAPTVGTAADAPTITVVDGLGAAGRVAAPAAVAITLPQDLLPAAKAGRLQLAEAGAAPFPAQFEPHGEDAATGTLRWLMPQGAKGPRRFRLTAASAAPEAMLTARFDEKTKGVEIAEGDKPVLRYNFGTVPVPKGVGGKYAVARSDYIHPLYGPSGEALTEDFSRDHPHHRGLYWAWPEVAYKGEMLDLHALQGVFARPVKLRRADGGPVAATVVAESRWMWHDKEPIVAEIATIRAYAERDRCRVVDLEFQFTALVEGVTIHRRGQKAYGGLNLRFSSRKGQQITHFTSPPDAKPRVCWGHIVGVPPGGTEPIGVAILQHAASPRYPGDWVQYPNLNWLQPTFPATGEKFPLSARDALVLRYRLAIRPGSASKETLTDLWTAYNHPPKPTAEAKP